MSWCKHYCRNPVEVFKVRLVKAECKCIRAAFALFEWIQELLLKSRVRTQTDSNKPGWPTIVKHGKQVWVENQEILQVELENKAWTWHNKCTRRLCNGTVTRQSIHRQINQGRDTEQVHTIRQHTNDKMGGNRHHWEPYYSKEGTTSVSISSYLHHT